MLGSGTIVLNCYGKTNKRNLIASTSLILLIPSCSGKQYFFYSTKKIERTLR